MNANSLPPLRILDECFTLSSSSPSGLVWKTRPRRHFTTNQSWKSTNRNYAGKAAGNLWTDSRDTKSQYWCVMVQGVTFVAHRIVYYLHSRKRLSPNQEIDHIDNDGLNNAIKNLRLATSFNNAYNKRKSKLNTSGFKGVVWHNAGKFWYGRVCYKGIRYRTLGCSTKERANELLKELRKTLHKDFTNHG